jgi:hypothetical protein
MRLDRAAQGAPGQRPALDLRDLAFEGVRICLRKGVFEAHAPA